MIPYIIFIFLILLFRSSKNPFCIYVTLVLFSVLRYDTGWDYMSYYNEVQLWGGAGIATSRYSFIWQWLFGTAQSLQMPHMAIAVPGFITVTLVFFSVKKLLVNPQKVCDALTIYAMWPFFYLGSFSTIRQALAVALGLVILWCAKENKKIWFIVLLVINSIIHPSSVVCVLYIFLFKKNFRIKGWQFILIIGAAVFSLYSIDWVVRNTSFLSVYSLYLEGTDSFGSKLSILLAALLIPTWMVRKKTVVDQGLTDICILSLLFMIVTFVFFSKSIFSRIADYYIILLIFVAPNFKYLFEDRRVGNVLVYLAFAGVFLVYLLITQGASAAGLATSPFVPYQFILFQ